MSAVFSSSKRTNLPAAVCGRDANPSQPIDSAQFADLVESDATGCDRTTAAVSLQNSVSPLRGRRCSSTDTFGNALRRLQRANAPVTPPDHADAVLDAMEPVEPVAADSSDGQDRRSFPRREAHGHASVTSFPHVAVPTPELADAMLRNEGVSGELIDLSRNGLAVLLLQPLPSGEEILVRLCSPGSDETRDKLAKVIRSIGIDGGLWKIVAQFVEPLSFDAAYELFERQSTFE